MSDPLRISASYRLRAAAGDGSDRAQVLALEQSIEMLASSVSDQRVLDTIVARVDDVTTEADGTHVARLALSAAAIGDDAGQLMNMLFGNSSLQPDVELVDVEMPSALTHIWGGPNHGIAGMRRQSGSFGRPLTCTALKPIGSTPDALAEMCRVFAASGIDVIKDDHGWANQRAAPFAERVRVCQRAVAIGNDARSSEQGLYAPSLYGHYGDMRLQLDLARREGVHIVLIAPMLCGVATLVALKREFDDMMFIAHPSLAGLRIAPAALFGKLFRLFGADAVIFPNHGGRFSFSRDACRAIALCNTQPWHDLKPALPTPAGGMSVERTAEMVAEYGRDSMLLIGGALLAAREDLAARSREFVNAVAVAAGDAVAA
jgi:ribulose-bisphosphate carboxylase large chain